MEKLEGEVWETPNVGDIVRVKDTQPMRACIAIWQQQGTRGLIFPFEFGEEYVVTGRSPGHDGVALTLAKRIPPVHIAGKTYDERQEPILTSEDPVAKYFEIVRRKGNS